MQCNFSPCITGRSHPKKMFNGGLTNDFLTHITIYCPLTDTRPFRYKESTSYDIRLFEEDFVTLQGFKNAIKERTRAGFLKSQFFRVTFDRNITDDTHTFISDDDDILQAFDSNRELPWQLIIVRYTKVQASRLRDKLKCGEQTELDLLTRQKRRYTRSLAPRDAGQDMNVSTASVATGDIYGHTDYVTDAVGASVTSELLLSQSLDCSADMRGHQPSFMHSNAHMLEYGAGFSNLPRSSGLTSSQDPTFTHRSSEDGCLLATDSMIHEQDRDIMTWSTKSPSTGPLTINEAVTRICDETPLGRLFSNRALKIWALEIILERHNSFSIPPSFFPIPDMYLRHCWRSVAVPIELQPISMLYAKYLADKTLEHAIASAEDGTDDDVSTYSAEEGNGNTDTNKCSHEGRIDNLSDDDEQINLI